jgi:tRNA(fMet)-specific endonuclease VapC
MKILLDTSAYVGFKLNLEQVVSMIANAEHIYFSPVVLGELMFGFRNGSRFRENMEDLNRFMQHEVVELVPVGSLTADRYSRIASHLKHQGTPIPTNDLWIAAQTMEYGAELVTSDKHFESISGLVCTIFQR